MKNLVKFFLVGIIAVTAVNCGGSAGNSPASIEKAIYSQFQKGNDEAGIKIYFENSTAEKTEKQDEMIKAFAEKQKESIEAKGGIKSFEIIEETIDESGETAIVVTKITYGDGTDKEEKNKYTKVEGKWKINAAGK